MAAAVIEVTATPAAKPASSAAFSLVLLVQCSSLRNTFQGRACIVHKF